MLIAGNWKMNTDVEEAVRLASEIVRATGKTNGVKVAVCPPFLNLEAVKEIIEGSEIALGAQNMHFLDSGAYTGEISAPMLKAVGCSYVILGHSERRQYFGETDDLVNKKACQATAHGLVPIICVGETLEERDAGDEFRVVERQVRGALEALEAKTADGLVIAYEPVWAIGTGRTASPEQAQEMHGAIRGWLEELYGEGVASRIEILYGGSMKPDNAAELLGQKDIDGGLIGGASLKAADFAAIVEHAANAVAA